jgi:F0F1-type ATP synthase assembly protein I
VLAVRLIRYAWADSKQILGLLMSDGDENLDDRAPMAKAMDWVARITTAGMTFGIPVLAGYWLDQKCGTSYLLTIAGFVLGMFAGGWQLMKIAISAEREAEAEAKK